MVKIIVFLFLPISLFSQETINKSEINQYAHSFEIKEGKLTGEGADTLKYQISNCQFLLFGEQHFSPEISELTDALIPELRKSNFKYFAIETGPHSAKKLVELIKDKNSLFNFNSKFHKKYNDIPFPFFDGVKDELFLKKAIENDLAFWGLDQEYLSAHLFLLDEIFNLSNSKESDRELFQKAKKFIQTKFRRYRKSKKYLMFTELLSSEVLEAFFQICKTNKQKQIISDLKTSWKIYAYNEKKNYSENNKSRMLFMKRKFGEHYFNTLKKDSLPKVFIKMGSMHLAKGKNWLGNYDLGNTINELSYLNGTKSISINCFSRFWVGDDGKINDYLDEQVGKDYLPILELAKKDKWVLIETTPILKLFKKKNVELNNNLRILLSGFNYVLFAPIQTKVKPNYSN